MKSTAFSLAVFALGACADGSANEVSQQEPVQEAPKVEVARARQDNPSYTITLPGELRPYEQVDIYPKVKGFVKEILVDRGSKVNKGQLLALLEAPEISQQLRSAQAQEWSLYEDYLYSKQAFNRLKNAAAKNGAVAAIELDRAKTKVQSDSAAYMAAKAGAGAVSEQRGYLRITAPFDGTVVSRNFSVGALVGEGSSAGTPLFTLAQQARLRLAVAVPEKHAQSLRKDTKVTFAVSSQPGRTYHTTLSRNSFVLNQQQRAVMVEFDVENRDGSLSGGEYAQVQLALHRSDSTVWVPASSVVRAQSGVFVLKVMDGRLQRVPVVEGMRKDTLQEIFGEIKAGDQVAEKGSEELPENVKLVKQ